MQEQNRKIKIIYKTFKTRNSDKQLMPLRIYPFQQQQQQQQQQLTWK